MQRYSVHADIEFQLKEVKHINIYSGSSAPNMFAAVCKCYVCVWKNHQRLAENIQKEEWFQFYWELNLLSLLKIIF